MQRVAAALVLTLLAMASCRTFDPKHPLAGRPPIDARQLGLWIWIEGGVWHVRASPGGHPHRFQGSVAGLSGGVASLTPTRAALKDRVALVGDAVQFDVDAAADDGSDGFDVRLIGGCAHFDLYLDGHHRPDHVRLGPRGTAPRHVPFDRCP